MKKEGDREGERGIEKEIAIDRDRWGQLRGNESCSKKEKKDMGEREKETLRKMDVGILREG